MNDEWLERAACRGLPNVIFFPKGADEGVGLPDNDAYRDARPVCARCPVRRECLEDELRFGLFGQHGMRGGLDAQQRRVILRDRLRRRWAS